MEARPEARDDRRSSAVYLAAWVPYAALWSSVAVYFGTSLADALALGLARYTLAALGGLLIRRLCRRLPWPERMGAGFVATHVAAALAFGVLLLSGNLAVVAVLKDRPFAALLAESKRYFPYELLMDACLYGLVGGVAYAIAEQRRAREERLRALAAQAAASRAQLDALRAQLNPHFLFNALHSLAALVRHDPERAEEALERLGGLLRYALDETGERVALRQEWAFVKDYLELEQLRFGARLAVEAACDADVAGVLVPPFTLQPLAENAIRHGVAAASGPSRVCVTARGQGERLVLRVEDDGPGCTQEALSSAGGLGLRALRERLAASYGDAVRCQFASAPGQGFVATVELPRGGP